ncbi:FAD-dependent oxidoreductase [Candidatus Binatus sp.]|uniref:FAD-dependent oxidoreductase n=1 Tax=Candidatus Binatus sp. TaxID=2811406 RepID=UPI003C73B6B3
MGIRIYASGQAPATENLGPEEIGIALDHGIIRDETLRTTVPNIWAAGDVRWGAHQLTMVAQHEGKIAAYNAEADRGRDRPVDDWYQSANRRSGSDR